jgi:hypothetical protein
MDNTSGQGSSAVVPAEIDQWNWGAFLLNWIWGLGNNTFIALLMFIPLANVPLAFVLGAKGSAWAWRHKRWQSVEHFCAVQRKWAFWGVAFWISGLVLTLGSIGLLSANIRQSVPFKLAVNTLYTHERAQWLLGKPFSTGKPKGRIKVKGPGGEAQIKFTVKGPRANGTVNAEFVRELGQWKVTRLTFEEQPSGQRFDLLE